MEIISKTEAGVPLFINRKKKEVLERNSKIYDRYKWYMSVEGQVISNVIEVLSEEFNLSFSNVYTIVRKMDRKAMISEQLAVSSE